MYHFSEPESPIHSHFYVVTSYLSTKDVAKGWVKEPTKFCQTPTNTYKIKYLKKDFQYLIALCCRTYGQQSTETFPEGWVFLPNQIVNEAKHSTGQTCSLNSWSSMYLMPKNLPREIKPDSTCLPTYWMQYALTVHFLAWIDLVTKRDSYAHLVQDDFRVQLQRSNGKYDWTLRHSIV